MKLVPVSASRAFGNAVLKTKKNSPSILFGVGVVGILSSTVLACRATLKLEPVLDDINKDVEKVKSKTYLEHDSERGKELFYAYVRAAKKLGVLYGPSVGVGIVSITALTKSHSQLKQRNAALTAAYTGLAQAFEDYRSRVRDAVGEEKENDIYLAVKEAEIDVDGKKKKVKGIDSLPPNAFWFNKQTSWNWEPDPGRNKWFLEQQERFWNQKLHVKGHVILNEVLDALGLERTQEGCVVGWLLDDSGSGYISFGMQSETNDRRFMNVMEWSMLLDFNVNPGVIFDKI